MHPYFLFILVSSKVNSTSVFSYNSKPSLTFTADADISSQMGNCFGSSSTKEDQPHDQRQVATVKAFCLLNNNGGKFSVKPNEFPQWNDFALVLA